MMVVLFTDQVKSRFECLACFLVNQMLPYLVTELTCRM